MSWKDFLEPASFRGIPFFVSSSDTTVGRRTKLHQYFRREKPFLQDLGSAADEFTVEGYVIQNPSNDFNHFPERDALIRALKKKGAGKLVHPYYGELEVGLVEPASISETSTEGGIARFSMRFAQAGLSTLKKTRDYRTFFDNLALILRAKGLDTFVDAFNATTEAIGDITAFLQNVANITTKIRNSVSSAIAKTTGAISDIITSLDIILDTPADVGNAILNGADAIQNAVGMKDEILFIGSIGGGSGLNDAEKNPNTLDGEVETVTLDGTFIPENLGIAALQSLDEALQYTEVDIENKEGMTISDAHAEDRTNTLNLFKLGLLINATQIGIRTEFTTKELLVENVELISEAIQTFLEELGAIDDGQSILYDTVYELQKSWVANMYTKGDILIQKIQYPIKGVENTLTLSYEKYEDITRENEIFEKNKPLVRHPGFLPAGDEIEILSE